MAVLVIGTLGGSVVFNILEELFSLEGVTPWILHSPTMVEAELKSNHIALLRKAWLFSTFGRSQSWLPLAGILLRRLLSDQDLQGMTHVIVDEVHERSVDSDLLLFPPERLAHTQTGFSPKDHLDERHR